MRIACGVRHTAPCRVIRNRGLAKPKDPSALTRADAEMWPLSYAVANGTQPAPSSLPRRRLPHTGTEREATALLAASTLVSTIFKAEDAQHRRGGGGHCRWWGRRRFGTRKWT